MTRAFYNPRLPRRRNSRPSNIRSLNLNPPAYQNIARQALTYQVPICGDSAPSSASKHTSNTLPPQISNVGEMDDWDMSSDKTSSSAETLVSDAGIRVVEKVLSRLAGCEEDEDMADIDGGGDEDLTASLPHQEATEDADDYNIGTFEDDEVGVPFLSSSRTTTSSDSNPDDPTTSLPHHAKNFTMSPFRAALSLYANKWNVSREQWEDLRSVLHLLEVVPPEVAVLPKRVDSIKEALDDQLPLLTMRSRTLELDPSLLPTRAKHQEDILLFDMKEFFRRLLQSKELMNRAHTSMAQYVDEPTEFWHSRSWGGSNRTTSGQFARVQSGSHKDEVILASDFVWWYDELATKIRIGRVTFVGVDLTDAARQDGTYGKVKLSIQAVWSYAQLNKDLQKKIDISELLSPNTEELFLVEDEEEVRILESALKKREKNVHMDYYHGTSTPSLPTLGRFHVRYLVSHRLSRMRPLALSHPHRGELEINTYGRRKIIDNLNGLNKTVVCLPYTLFIDTFGLYRNMYRPIPGFYAQFAFMNQLDRKRRINVFPITLAPFAARWDEVVSSLIHLKELETGVEVELDDGSKTTVCSPCLAYVGDMPQQQSNAGCKNQKAEHYCRSCLISSKDTHQENFAFDIVANGRYHYETERIRNETKGWSKQARDNAFRKLGLADTPSLLANIHQSLCIPIAFPGDVAHSEFKGIARQVLNLLFTDILKPQFHETFAREFASTPTPPTWAQMQNIHKYIGSYSMQEFGRASMLTPVVLRKWLLDIHLRSKVPAAIEHVLNKVSTDTSAYSGVNFIVHCYATMARLNAVIMGPYIRKQDRNHINSLIQDARQRMQDLVDVAVAASTKSLPHARLTQPTSQTSSPLNSERPPSLRNRTPTYKALYADEFDLSEYETDENEDEASQLLLSEEEEEHVATPGKIPRRGKLTQTEKESKRLEALSRKKFTPNVHTILHINDTINEFGSARNVTTWSGEDKHK